MTVSDPSEQAVLLKPMSLSNYTNDMTLPYKPRPSPFASPSNPDPCDCRYLFVPEKLKKPQVYSWLILQAVCLFLQFSLWSEMTSHIFDFQDAIALNCNVANDGLCVGNGFRVAYTNTFAAVSGDFEQKFSFDFNTTSTPPTFLVSVVPQPEEVRSRFSIEVKQDGSGLPAYFRGPLSGSFSGVVTDRSSTSADERIKWRAKLIDNEWSPDDSVPRKYQVQVQEAMHSQVIAARANEQCDFEKSWQAVNSVASGDRTEGLSLLRTTLTFSIFVSAFCIWLVLGWYGSRRPPLGLEFHYLVGIKWLIQDMPLQITSLLYVFRWFNSSGERCQLCLFDPVHCEQLSPFHFSNLILVIIVLASSLVNQSLVNAKFDRNDDDQAVAVWGARIAMASVSVLPFSTAMILFNGSLIAVPGFFHAIFAIPCMVGWISLFCLVCFPLAIIIESEIESQALYVP